MADVWTIDSLKEHIEKILSEKDKAINIALAAAKEAVGVAETNAEKWRDNANEWRSAMTDRESKFLTRQEFELYKESTEKLSQVEKTRADKAEGKSIGISAGWGWAVAVIMLAITVFTFFIKFNP